MATVSKSFTAVGVGEILTVPPGKSVSYSVSGTFVGTVQLQQSATSGATWEPALSDAPPNNIGAATAAASGSVTNKTKGSLWYRFACTAYTSGTIVTSVADANDIVYEVKDPVTGAVLACFKDDGVALPGALTLTGALSTGAAVNSPQGADIASASTVDLDSATGNVVDVTGTTGISTITLSQGRFRIVRFTGALTLTHGASLVLPGAADIVTVAGDYAIFVGYASGVVRCAGYFRNAVPYETGSFTATATGFSGSVTGTAYYARVGNQVTVYWPSLTGTSNAATFTATGLPVNLRPARVQGNFVGPAVVDNGGATTAGVVTLQTNGTLQVYKSPTATGSDWTASGTKTLSLFQMTYLLN